jgi:hypothetical protein
VSTVPEPTGGYECPMGHPFPRLNEVPCEQCGSTVVCIPVAALIAAGDPHRIVHADEVLQEQLNSLLSLVREAGTALQDHAALIAEHGGDLEDLRGTMAMTGRLGESMVQAVERTRSKLEEELGEDWRW